jgi:hypothetical protein
MAFLRRWPKYPKLVIVVACLMASLPAAAYVILLDNRRGLLISRIGSGYEPVLRVLAVAMLAVAPVAVLGLTAAWLGYRRRLAGLASAGYASALALPTTGLAALTAVFLRNFLPGRLPGASGFRTSVDFVLRDVMSFHVAQALYVGSAAVLIVVAAQWVGRRLAERRMRQGRVEFSECPRTAIRAWAVEHPAWAMVWLWIAVFGAAALAAGTLGELRLLRRLPPLVHYHTASGWVGSAQAQAWYYTTADWIARAALPLAAVAGGVLVFLRAAGDTKSRFRACLAAAIFLCVLCGGLARLRAYQDYYGQYADHPFLGAAAVGYAPILRNWDSWVYRIGNVKVDLAGPRRLQWRMLRWASEDARGAVLQLTEPLGPAAIFTGLWTGPLTAPLVAGLVAGHIVRWRRDRLVCQTAKRPEAS